MFSGSSVHAAGKRHNRGGWLFLIVLPLAVLALGGASAFAQSKRGIPIGGGVSGALILLDKLSSVKGKKSKSSSGSSLSSKKKKSYAKKSDDSESLPRTSKKTSGPSEKYEVKRKSNSDGNGSMAEDTQSIGNGVAKSKQTVARPESESRTDKAADQPATTAPQSAVAAAAEKAAPAGPALISTPAEIKAAQDHLRYLGYDLPVNNGTSDLNTKIAIMKYQDSIGAPSTGFLTVEQLQTLFMKAAEKQGQVR